MTAIILTGVASIKVAPGIGLGCVGSSGQRFAEPQMQGVGHRSDEQGRVKRQAQRFRIYAYAQNRSLLGEVVEGAIVNGAAVSLNWQVHVTNTKSANYASQTESASGSTCLRNFTVQAGIPPEQRDKLIIDPGIKSVSGANHESVELIDPIGSKIFDVQGSSVLSGILDVTNESKLSEADEVVEFSYTPAIVSLGNISTDNDGRLIFMGGKGESKSCTTPNVAISKAPLSPGVQTLTDSIKFENEIQNNPGWYDDTCSGSINASIVDRESNTELFSTSDNASQRGWVAVAAPNYASAPNKVVSLLDLQMDICPEADPYSGTGPFYIAQTTSSGDLELATLSSAPPIGNTPIALPFVSIALPGRITTNQPPAMINYQGVNHIAIVSDDGLVYIGVESTPNLYTFSVVPGVCSASSAASLAVLDNALYIGVNSRYGIMLGKSTGGDFSFTTVSKGTFSVCPEQAPTLQAFNGVLHVATVDFINQLLIANSGENIDGAITLSRATLQSNDDETGVDGVAGISLTTHLGAIRLGFVCTRDNKLYIANSTDGETFTYSCIAEGSGKVDENGVSLSSFNNKLYYSFANTNTDRKLGVSSNGDDFTFQAMNGASPYKTTISANIPVNFHRDIYPLLKKVTACAWVKDRVFHGHNLRTFGDFLNPTYLPTLASPNKVAQTPQSATNMPSPDITRLFVFNFIRRLAQQVALGNGGTFAQNDARQSENEIDGSVLSSQKSALTDHQLEKFQQWVNGNFETGTVGEATYQDIPEADQLSFAALQPAVGGDFHAGIKLAYSTY